MNILKIFYYAFVIPKIFCRESNHRPSTQALEGDGLGAFGDDVRGGRNTTIVVQAIDANRFISSLDELQRNFSK